MNIEERYQEALSWLFAQLPMFSRVGAAAYKPGLERVRALSEVFGNPEKKLRAIHVAGTNGKGSTSHMLAAVLQAAGYKTALYTSPHLVDFRERMRINGAMIPKEEVIRFVDRWQNMDYAGDRPSFFELTMMMAFDWFAREEVDYAVIETGMGGRLDSTNILSPLLCVITNISLDHTQFLGHSLPEIAAEKAGIVKEGVPVVIGEAEGDVRAVFERKAEEMQAPAVFAEDRAPASAFSLKDDYSGWRCVSDELGEVEVDLAGDYQQKNIATVLTAIGELRRGIIPLDAKAVREGLAHAASSTGLLGRWSILGQSPLTVCDTGHNTGGLEWNLRRLRALRAERGGRLRMLIGFVADKAIDEILDMMPKDAEYYVTNADIPRALPAADLLTRCGEHGLTARSYTDVAAAYAAMRADAEPADILYIGGSTFIVADLLSDQSATFF